MEVLFLYVRMGVLFEVGFVGTGRFVLSGCGFFVYWESHFVVSVWIRVGPILIVELTGAGYIRTRLYGFSVILRNFDLLFWFELFIRINSYFCLFIFEFYFD